MSSDNESTQRSAQDDLGDRSIRQLSREALTEANELLESLEHTHRNDLALHLYSTFLLKSVLKAANRKKYGLETNTFIKTQIKDNWTSWPNPSTVIDPKIDTIFEDVNGWEAGPHSKSSLPGNISPDKLLHASKMVQGELNAVWQQSLTKMAIENGVVLDIDKMDIPNGVASAVLSKMDHFFKGLHTNVASMNKLIITQASGTSQLKVTEHQPNEKPLEMNRKIKLDYHDVITRGCQMGDEMFDVYMKGLELFSDIPSKYRNQDFRLPKEELIKYTTKKKDTIQEKLHSGNKRPGYILAEKLLRQNTLSFINRIKLRSILHKHRDRSLDEKTYLHLENFANTHLAYREEDNEYGVTDCLVPIFRTKSRYARKKLR
ncbi:LAFA_0D03400g1_1 [Lachancea sp. 'fantastica']|nr:LAFA_0D03400g1_1 [Lachancea sp. 'fantastica']